MKNKIVFLMLMCLSVCMGKAQRLVVYSLMGKVEVTEDGQTRQVHLRDAVKADAMLNIPYRGCVVIFDTKRNLQYTLKTPGRATVIQMVGDRRNTVRKLSQQYAAYIGKQIKGDKQTLVRNCSDPATVTRDLRIYNTNLAATDNDLSICGEASFSELAKKDKDDFDGFLDDINGEFDDFVRDINEDFENFREEINREFIAFLRHPWESFESKEPLPKPKDEEIKPAPLPRKELEKAPVKPEELPAPVVVEPEPLTVDPQPQPVAPVKPNEVVTEQFEFTNFGTKLRVCLGKGQQFRVASVGENDVANAMEHLMGKEYENALYDCLNIRKERQLCDWAYYQMLKDLGDAFCGKGSNESALLTAHLMLQSGYKLRLGRADGKLYVLPHTNHRLCGMNYFGLPDGNFFVLDGDIHRMDICNVPFHAEKPLSLYIPQNQQYEIRPDEEREIKSKYGGNIHVNIHTNQNLIDFFNTYPTSEINNNLMSRWAMYANTPLDPYVKDQLNEQIPPQLQGLSDYDKVSRLLDFCQTGLTYEFDNTVWGHDRAFFAEESLHYPFADCEDRSILFTRLVREYVGLPCVLIYYPGHLAAGVCFGGEPINGEFIEVKGKRFVITDPTYIGAPVGMGMKDLDRSASQAIILE